MTTDPNHEQSVILPRDPRVKIIGVGGAGSSAVEQLSRSELGALPLAIVHTHARVLQQRDVANRVLVGVNRTHGLGSGGDAELARVMAENDKAQLVALGQDADLVFILAGLGGGTGTGLTPVLARTARESGALVIAIVTTPFEFEGTRRQKQAHFGIQHLRAAADAVICIPNEKLSRLLSQDAAIVQAFACSNDLLGQGVRGIWRMLTRPGLINVDFSYLQSVLRGRHTESTLATAEGQGEHRVRDVLDQLMANPLLEEGKALAEADQVLVSVVASNDLTIAEVNKMMEQFRRRMESDQLIFGTAIDPEANGKISVTLIASKNCKSPVPAMAEIPVEVVRQSAPLPTGVDAGLMDDAAVPRPAPRFVAPPPESTPENTRELLERQPNSRIGKRAKWKQELLALEIVSRGRFEKSEPTIHRGADLDVPTYIRRGVPLN